MVCQRLLRAQRHSGGGRGRRQLWTVPTGDRNDNISRRARGAHQCAPLFRQPDGRDSSGTRGRANSGRGSGRGLRPGPARSGDGLGRAAGRGDRGDAQAREAIARSLRDRKRTRARHHGSGNSADPTRERIVNRRRETAQRTADGQGTSKEQGEAGRSLTSEAPERPIMAVNSYRVLVADDHGVVRHGLRVLLESQPGVQVCGEARTGLEAIDYVKKEKPDLLILDLTMPDMNGLEVM